MKTIHNIIFTNFKNLILFWVTIMILFLTADIFYIPWITPQHLKVTNYQKVFFNLNLICHPSFKMLRQKQTIKLSAGLVGQLYEVTHFQQALTVETGKTAALVTPCCTWKQNCLWRQANPVAEQQSMSPIAFN